MADNNKSKMAENRKSDGESSSSGIGAAIGAVFGIAYLGYKVVTAFSGSPTEDNRKTMKAPGRDYRIYRDDFESDPASYFRNLRK